MVSRSTRSSRSIIANNNERTGDEIGGENARDNSRAVEDQPRPPNVQAVVERNVLPTAVRDRQRAVAEREASRLARPDGSKSICRLSHADRKKSAVTSTPSGIVTVSPSGKSDPMEVAGTEEWCGPWSVARQMIAKREDAKRRREEIENDDNANGENHPLDEAMVEFSLERKRKQHPSMQWTSSSSYQINTNGKKESLYGKRQKRMNMIQQGKKVPSLLDLCVAFLADNVDSIESLGIDTDADVRTAVMDRLIADQLLNDDAFNALAEVGIDTLQISDGSNVTEECLSKRLEILLPSGLKNLSLDQCGRCFTATAVHSIITTASKKKLLQNLLIGGAYGLQDIDAAQLIKCVAPPSLGFKACNLLGKLTCQTLCDTYANTPLIELYLEDIPLTSDDLKIMTSKVDAWKNLMKLSLRRVNGLEDSLLHSMFEMCRNTLEYLDLTDNVQLSDATLASLRDHNVARRLHTLILQGLNNLTAIGLEAFFTETPSETDLSSRSPIMLQVLNLGQCSHDAVTDEVIRLVTGGAPIPCDISTIEALDGEDASTSMTIPTLTNMSYHSLGSGGLVSLNVQGSTMLTDTAMEYLASNKSLTYRTLKELNISFCPNLTDQGVGYLIDSCQPQLRTINVWGNAQLTDNVFDGHQRVDDPSLAVVGIWMKKASSRTIR